MKSDLISGHVYLLVGLFARNLTFKGEKMFESYPRDENVKECRPDYEQAAARMKKRIDANRNFLNAFAVFSEVGSFHELNRDNSMPLYALFGALSLRIPQMDREYEEILKRIEDRK